jgi:hypothetical protein
MVREISVPARPTSLAVIGLGQGHLLDNWTGAPDACAGDQPATAPQPSAASEGPDHGSSVVWVLTAPDFAGSEDAWRISCGARRVPAHHAPRRDGAPGHRAAHGQEDRVRGAPTPETRRKFAPRYLRNVVRNTAAIVNGRDVRPIGQIGRSGPPITAAGTIADSTIEAVRGPRTGADLSPPPRCDPRSARDAPPVVGADPGQANARHFQEPQIAAGRGSWRVGAPSAAAAFAGFALWFRLSNHRGGHGDASRHRPGSGRDEGIGADGSVQVAYHAGCDLRRDRRGRPLFTSGRPCRGTVPVRLGVARRSVPLLIVARADVTRPGADGHRHPLHAFSTMVTTGSPCGSATGWWRTPVAAAGG